MLAKLLTSHFYLNGNAREYKLLILGRFSNNARHMRTRKRAERRNGRDFRYLICLSAIGRGFEIWANDHGDVFESAVIIKSQSRSLKHHLSRLSELVQLVKYSLTLRKTIDRFFFVSLFFFSVRSSRSSANCTTWPSWLHTVHLKPRWPQTVRVSFR